MKAITLDVRGIGYSEKRNRVIFNFNNEETAGLGHGVPCEWFAKKLADYGIKAVTLPHIQLLIKYGAITAHCNSVEILPAGSMIEGREKATEKDNLQLTSFDFQIDPLGLLKTKKKLTPELLEGVPTMFSYSVVTKTTSSAATAAAAAAKAAMEASANAGISEDEEEEAEVETSKKGKK